MAAAHSVAALLLPTSTSALALHRGGPKAPASHRTLFPARSAAQVSTQRMSTLPAPKAASLDIILDEAEVPTPVVPSTRMMADFLVTYGRVLKHFCASGDGAAAAGSYVLERVRVGVMTLLDSRKDTAEWVQDEQELETCLIELQKDIELIEKYRGSQPARIAVKMASLRCAEAAHLLKRL